MPYILLIVGALTGLYAFYRFFLSASPAQIRALFLAAVLFTLSCALFFMAVTGRLPAALALLVAIAPVAGAYLKHFKTRNAPPAGDGGTGGITTRSEALAVFGLPDGANEDDINTAYKKLMQKIHPDHEGSAWMAARLNQARDVLLGRKA